MDLKAKKIFLEIYGVFRMALGVGQIVGLFSGYFLLEWIARYPLRALYVIDEEGVALVFLVVLLKGAFHIAAGIGIARFKAWARWWLLYGWLIVALMTYGLVSSLAQDWIDAGMIAYASEVFIGSRIFIYLAVIIFDCTIVSSLMKDVDEDFDTSEGVGVRLEGKKIGSFLIAGVFFFMVLLLFGRPIQKGFHQGYYKLKEGSVIKTPKNYQSSLTVTTTTVRVQKKEAKAKASLDVLEPQRIAIVVENPKIEKEELASKVALEPMKKEIKKEIPYRSVFGFLGGFLIFIGLLFQMFDEKKEGEELGIPLPYMFLCLGFLFWVVYGLSIKQPALAFTSGMIFLLCAAGIFFKLRRE